MKKREKKVLFPISVTIFTLFSLTLVLLMSAITGFVYTRSSADALFAAEKLMEQTSREVFMKLENLYEPLLYITEQAVDLPILGEKPTLQNHPAEKFLINTINSYPQIQIIYIGYSDGDFYEILSFSGSSRSQLQQAVRAPGESRYGILRQFSLPGQTESVRLWKYLNSDYQTIGSAKEAYTGYDPRNRPWYVNAMNSWNSVKTDPYMFSNVKKMGLTISRKIDGTVSGVLGTDILLDEMAGFLEEVATDSSSLVLVFNKDRKVTAFPSSLQTYVKGDDPCLSDFPLPEMKSFISYLSLNDLSPEIHMTLDTEDGPYMVQVRALPEKYSNNEYLFMAVPRKTVLASVQSTAQTTAIISVLLILLCFPLIYLISRYITTPLHNLEKEAVEIGRYNLTGEINVKSRITEVHNLSNEMTSMKRGLRSFGRYIPQSVVRQIMDSRMKEGAGGISREMTFLFSDIQGFTNLAENMDPEVLMKRLSGYFKIISREIKSTSGTIDKFIGDAVMAFWNAPDFDPDHKIHACETALEIQKIIGLNEHEWVIKGLNTFHTRIGIYSGTAVVGNVGSMDRMNYTAIGDAVNSCSRLESINKLYGTRIIAGESVINSLDNRFLYRPLENIIPKGKSSAQTIYELIGYKEDCSAGQTDFACFFTEGFELFYSRKFDEAVSVFDKAARINPSDPALISFLESSRRFCLTPPCEDWTGVRILRRK